MFWNFVNKLLSFLEIYFFRLWFSRNLGIIESWRLLIFSMHLVSDTFILHLMGFNLVQFYLLNVSRNLFNYCFRLCFDASLWLMSLVHRVNLKHWKYQKPLYRIANILHLVTVDCLEYIKQWQHLIQGHIWLLRLDEPFVFASFFFRISEGRESLSRLVFKTKCN